MEARNDEKLFLGEIVPIFLSNNVILNYNWDESDRKDPYFKEKNEFKKEGANASA